MAIFIYSITTSKAQQSFYLLYQGKEYYLFTQKFYIGVKNYFHNKVLLKDALDMTKSNHRDTALLRTKNKLWIYIKYIQKKHNITILDNSCKSKINLRKNDYCKNNLCDYSNNSYAI